MKLTIDEAKRHRDELHLIAEEQHIPDEGIMTLAQTLDKIIAGKPVDLPKKYHFLFKR